MDNCTLFGKVVFHRNIGYSETIYTYTQVEQTSKWMVNGGSQPSHFGVRSYRKARSRRLEWTSVTGLESKISVGTHV